ncbi:peptidoglycan-binding domain-containing protein [Streptomyces sp. NPDC046261]|uniref:peptidoglycan-binding domain-containing protein n=1 Tax=Streptomyces sp. NPDC046261 TaxID=3157200 RepID=UPI0033DC6724
MNKSIRGLVPAALAGTLLLGGAVTATAADTSTAPGSARATQAVNASFHCGYHDGSKYADIGDRGDHVKEIQCLLNNYHGIDVGPSGFDGKFGPATQRAVKTFQGRNGLSADGIVGPKTWKKLRGN